MEIVRVKTANFFDSEIEFFEELKLINDQRIFHPVRLNFDLENIDLRNPIGFLKWYDPYYTGNIEVVKGNEVIDVVPFSYINKQTYNHDVEGLKIYAEYYGEVLCSEMFPDVTPSPYIKYIIQVPELDYREKTPTGNTLRLCLYFGLLTFYNKIKPNLEVWEIEY